jgi:SAM-dependent methyltransferase
MSRFVEPDWNARYVSGDVPWDSGHPSTELRRVVEETDELPRGRLLELGCGTGTNAVYLAQNGFQVTAVDGSSEAIARANARLESAQFDQRKSSVVFHCANVVDLPAALSDVEPNQPHVEPFDVLFDRGCYHCVRRADLPGFQSMLDRVTRSGTLFLLFAGNAKETREGRGPPTVGEPELRAELGGTFDFVRLTEFRFDETGDGETGDGSRPLAWSVLLRRK